MTIERTNPPWIADEPTMLTAWLETHRATLAVKCEGLTPEQLCQRSVPPSTLSLIGLVRHMAEVERHWFRRVLAGEDAPPLYYSETDPDGDIDNVEPAVVAEAFTTWEAECDRSRQILADLPLDAVGTHPRANEDVSARWVAVHMIEEYARHNGHADLLRETIDGQTGE